MYPVVAIIHVAGLFPLMCAFRANRGTPLEHALGWAAAAWLAWVAVIASGWIQPEIYPITESYLALTLTGCAGMAVLGARRPGVAAWNFVVAGLLAVLLLPLAERWDEPRLSWLRSGFLAVTLLIVPFNYLLTRLGLAALALGIGCGLEMAALLPHAGFEENAAVAPLVIWGRLLVSASLWIAWGSVRTKEGASSEFDRLWLNFRDRFGMTWALRVREQFNRSAAHAGWPARLGWNGLHGAAREEMTNTLGALLTRFGQAERGPALRSEDSASRLNE